MSTTAIATVPLIPASKFALSFFRIDVTIDMPLEQASYAIADVLPVNAVPCSVSVNFPFGVGGTLSTNAGLGIATNPSKYFLSPDKLPFEQTRDLDLGAVRLAAIENLLLSGVDNLGVASGTIGGVGISAVVSIAYFIKVVA